MDLASWLQDLGLERYAQTFRDHEVDLDVLGDLTEADLEKLGIPLGHRKKLLKAIARQAAPETAIVAERPRTEAERRQLTVMFVDLVGSTELSTRLDPEDMGALIRAFQDCCAEVVNRWGGHLAKFMGDGALVNFGWPQAHEDDAERAVRAGLELARAVATLSTPADARLAVRIGIATGPVLVGELAGAGAAQEEAVVGETPNLAARLQALADPGTVVVAARTRRLLGGLFTLTDLGPVRLKGFAEAMSAFRVEGEGHTEGRFEALRGGRLTPLVGREHELAVLEERWAWAKEGDGQVVLLAGEPGIGKSRLLRALRDQLCDEAHVALSHFCSPYHTNSALHPIISQLERAAGLTPGDAAEVKLAKLEALLGQATEQLDEALRLLAALLGIPTGDRYPALTLSPQRQKQRTLEVLIAQLAGLARDRPVLELYEDLHWVDPSTLELLDLLVERVRGLPVLAVLTYRPEFTPPWSGRAHVTSLPLNRLGRRQGAAMVAHLTGGKALPDEVLGEIVGKTDGVPLFLEELTKTVLESGLLRETDETFALDGPLRPLAVPATLHDSLMARLDRLGPIKEVAQTAAVIGREFSHDLLAAVSPMPETDLDSALNQLVTSGLLFRRGTPPRAAYTFKHAMVQDAAYLSLLKSKIRQLHGLIAQAIEEQFEDIADQQPELLAHHWTEAGAADRAVCRWKQAGARAAQRFAYVEAIAHFRKALQLLRDVSASAERDRQELSLWLALGPALFSGRSWAAPEVGEAYVRAHELARVIAEPTQVFTATWGLWTHNIHSTKLEAARSLATELMTIAEGHARAEMLLQAHHASWTTYELLGEPTSCLRHAVQGRALYGAERHQETLHYGGHDTGVCARFHEASASWQVGYPDKALGSARDAVALAERLGHPLSLICALFYLAAVHWLRREADPARRCANDVIGLCRQHDIPHYLGAAEVVVGWAEALAQKTSGLSQIEQGLADLDRGGPPPRKTDCLLMLAEACFSLPHLMQASAALEQARAFIGATGLRRSYSEIARLEGRLSLQRPEAAPNRAEHCFEEALATARTQGARSLELRAATDLARLWVGQSRRVAARDLLAPIYGWFTEGFDTADLKEASTLLDELR